MQIKKPDTKNASGNKDAYIPIELSDAYAMMSDEQKDKVQGLYISKDPITITKENATYQNGTNGMMNNEGLALFNVMEQTGILNQMKDDPTKEVEATVSYNPTRGMLADLLESGVDKLGGTTGIAKQTGEFIRDVTTQRGVNGSNFTMHSQGNIIAHNGIAYVQSADNTGTKFLPADKFKSTVPNASGSYDGTPTFESFGSPVSGEDMNKVIGEKGLKYNYIGTFTHDNDLVGEGLGGNNGVNGQLPIYNRLDPIEWFYKGFAIHPLVST